jgi:hypothetical protein
MDQNKNYARLFNHYCSLPFKMQLIPLLETRRKILVVQWGEFLASDPEVQVRFPALPVVVGLERGPLSLVSTTEELLGRKSSGSGLEIRDYSRRGSAALTTRHPSIRKS